MTVNHLSTNTTSKQIVTQPNISTPSASPHAISTSMWCPATHSGHSLVNRNVDHVSKTIDSVCYPDENEKKTVAGKFESGDIIFCYKKSKGGSDVGWIDRIIVSLQKFRSFVKKEKNDYTNCVHVAIVTAVDKQKGEVLIAEAMPGKEGGGVRTVDFLTHNSCHLEIGSGFEYEIVRANKYQEMAASAAKIADLMGKKASYLLESKATEGSSSGVDTAKQPLIAKDKSKIKSEKSLKNKYSFTLGLRAFISSGRTFGLDARRRAVKSIFDANQQHAPALDKKGKPRQFICSSLVGYVLQRAAAIQQINKSQETPTTSNEHSNNLSREQRVRFRGIG